MENIYCIYVIATLMIVFGFIALLTQKVYIDPDTNEPIEIEIAGLAKLKTNFPAIAFVFIGAGLAYYVFDTSYRPEPNKVAWTVKGAFEHPDGDDFDWQDGTLSVRPTDIEAYISDEGNYIIEAYIEEGRSFEETIQLIDYTHKDFTIQILPQEEFEKFQENRDFSIIDTLTPNTRTYKMKKVTELWRTQK